MQQGIKKLQWFECFKVVFLKILKAGLSRVFANQVTYALATPRRIPLPLKSQVEEELCCMEQFQKVDTPTEWCARMVTFSKGNNKVCMC